MEPIDVGRDDRTEYAPGRDVLDGDVRDDRSCAIKRLKGRDGVGIQIRRALQTGLLLRSRDTVVTLVRSSLIKDGPGNSRSIGT